jgi:hypothetical protein
VREAWRVQEGEGGMGADERERERIGCRPVGDSKEVVNVREDEGSGRGRWRDGREKRVDSGTVSLYFEREVVDELGELSLLT